MTDVPCEPPWLHYEDADAVLIARWVDAFNGLVENNPNFTPHGPLLAIVGSSPGRTVLECPQATVDRLLRLFPGVVGLCRALARGTPTAPF